MDTGTHGVKLSPGHNRKIRRTLRLAGWNALWLAVGLALAVAGAELWLRLTTPFTALHRPQHFVPGVGLIMKPDAEVRWTNHLDYWTVSRTNSLGFLDREPVSAERAAAGCHIAMIGDSFVEALEVPIVEKFHVRLEELAARELPHLDVITSAFGVRGFGQINQLPLYDEFARHLHPRLLVLVFFLNDFGDNTPVLDALYERKDPDRLPWVSATRNGDGTIALRPPHPDWQYRLPLPPLPSHSPRYRRVLNHIARFSYTANWLAAKDLVLHGQDLDPQLMAGAELLGRRPGHAALLDGWQPTTGFAMTLMFRRKDLPPYFEEALDFTAFALDRFKERAERDGVSLVILTTHWMRTRGHPPFDRLNAMAEARGIPVVNQHDYILRQGARPRDAQWAHDGHWNAAGHQWAAAALLEYLKENQDVCAGPSPPPEG